MTPAQPADRKDSPASGLASALRQSGIITSRRITHNEAREIAQRLINSHFRTEPGARMTVPAEPDRDDDLLIIAYIEQNRERDAE
jgi:hypothetical protein